MKMLKPGDPCPFCGQPIKTRDPAILELLTQIAGRRYFPTFDAMQKVEPEQEPSNAE